MIELIRGESIYLWYYFSIQVELIAPYWVLGVLLGSFVSVFARGKIFSLFLSLQHKRLGMFGLVPASLLGIASPLCMYGTIPIAASFSEKGMRDDWLAAFMMSSMLLNPQLLMFSAALGERMLVLRFAFCFLCGVFAGSVVKYFFHGRPFFSFENFGEGRNRDTHPNLIIRFLFNVSRNVRATGPYFLLGILLTALYQRYVPQELVAGFFGEQSRGFGVLTAAALGVPLYVCGGGTIPLLAEWLQSGMSQGSALAFMLSGPATKITNLSALKAVFDARHFLIYLGFVILLAVTSGALVEIMFG